MIRLYRQRSTALWFPIEQSSRDVTPGTAYFADLARVYHVPVADIEVVMVTTRPADFETNVVPKPTPPPPVLSAESDPLLKAVVLTLLDAINQERQTSGRPAITPQQFMDAARAKL